MLFLTCIDFKKNKIVKIHISDDFYKYSNFFSIIPTAFKATLLKTYKYF